MKPWEWNTFFTQKALLVVEIAWKLPHFYFFLAQCRNKLKSQFFTATSKHFQHYFEERRKGKPQLFQFVQILKCRVQITAPMLGLEERQTEIEGSQQGFQLLTTCFRQLFSKEGPKMCVRAPNKKIISMNQWHSVLKAHTSLLLKEKTSHLQSWWLDLESFLLLTPWLWMSKAIHLHHPPQDRQPVRSRGKNKYLLLIK